MILPEIGEMCQIVRRGEGEPNLTLWTGRPKDVQLQWEKLGDNEFLKVSVWDGERTFEWLARPNIVVVPIKDME